MSVRKIGSIGGDRSERWTAGGQRGVVWQSGRWGGVKRLPRACRPSPPGPEAGAVGSRRRHSRAGAHHPEAFRRSKLFHTSRRKGVSSMVFQSPHRHGDGHEAAPFVEGMRAPKRTIPPRCSTLAARKGMCPTHGPYEFYRHTSRGRAPLHHEAGGHTSRLPARPSPVVRPWPSLGISKRCTASQRTLRSLSSHVRRRRPSSGP